MRGVRMRGIGGGSRLAGGEASEERVEGEGNASVGGKHPRTLLGILARISVPGKLFLVRLIFLL